MGYMTKKESRKEIAKIRKMDRKACRDDQKQQQKEWRKDLRAFKKLVAEDAKHYK
jgi:hypothetical protein